MNQPIWQIQDLSLKIQSSIYGIPTHESSEMP